MRILFVACLSFLLVALSACGNAGQNEGNAANSDNKNSALKEKITLTFWNGFTGADGELLKTIVDDYNKANVDTVEIKMDIMPWDQLNQKLPPAIATKTAPSFVAMIGGVATPYIHNGSFQDLSSFFEQTGASKDEYTSGALDLGVKEGNPYLLPMQMNGLYLFWNKALFQAAGLDPETPPATLTELADYAVRLTDPSKNQFGFGMPVSGAPAYYTSLIIGNGGDVVDMESKTSVLNSPENVATYEWIQDLVVNKKVSPKGATGADLDKMMQSGQLAMAINGPWLAPGLSSSSIDFGVTIPPSGSATRYIELGGIGFAVPSVTSKEEVKAIYDFIKYWNSPEISKKWSISNGFPPYLKSVIEDPEIIANPLVATMANMGDSAKPFLPGLLSADRINNEILFKSIEAVQNGLNVSDVLKDVSGELDEILKTEK
jgi:multiple sugar transport system substrate-binding protein